MQRASRASMRAMMRRARSAARVARTYAVRVVRFTWFAPFRPGGVRGYTHDTHPFTVVKTLVKRFIKSLVWRWFTGRCTMTLESANDARRSARNGRSCQGIVSVYVWPRQLRSTAMTSLGIARRSRTWTGSLPRRSRGVRSRWRGARANAWPQAPVGARGSGVGGRERILRALSASAIVAPSTGRTHPRIERWCMSA